jgi:hypothetical protein
MAFKVSLPELKDTLSKYTESFQVFETALESSHNAVMSLSENGWTGIAQTQFYEKFYKFIQSGGKLYEKISYMGECLELCVQMADVLKLQYEHLPLTVGAEAGVSNGTVYLNQGYKTQVSAYARVLQQVEWLAMKTNLSTARDAVGALQYRSFAIHSDLGNQVTDLNAKIEKLEQFSLEFSDYDNNVTAFEQQNAVRFEYVQNEAFSYDDAMKFLDSADWTDATGLGLDIAAISARVAFKIPTKIVTQGTYTYFSGFPKGTYSGRYLTTNLQNGTYANASRAFKLNSAMKVASWAMIGISAAYSGYEEYNRNPYLPTERKVINTTVAVAFDVATSVGAAAAGAKIGAALGTLIPIPVVGTVVGAIAGAAIGVGVNWLINQDWFGGKSIKEHVSDAVNVAWDGIKTGAGALADGAKKVWGWLTGSNASGTLQPANP